MKEPNPTRAVGDNMQHVKCLKCSWKGSSVDTLEQWLRVGFDTQELLMICPECKIGVCVENKAKKASPNGEPLSSTQPAEEYPAEG